MQGAQDSRKAKLWGKIAKQVLQAAKQGGVSPESNARLKEVPFHFQFLATVLSTKFPGQETQVFLPLQVLYQAKQLAIPKDIIDRNLKKAADKDQADFSEV